MKRLTVLLAALLVAIALPALAKDKPAAAPAGGDDAAKALFEKKCSACHSIERPLGKTKDRGEWEKTVTRMQKVNGCPITDAEAKTIVDYLARVRGPAAAPGTGY